MRRFSIAALMGVVLVCAVVVAAVRSASETWAAVVLTLTLLTLGVSVLGAIERTGSKRSFWRGFAVFAGCYFALVFSPWSGEKLTLPTTQLLGYIHDQVQAARPRPPNQVRLGIALRQYDLAYRVQTEWGSSVPPPDAGGTPSTLAALALVFAGAVNDEPFRRIGHCLFALLAGLLGGLIARRFQRTNRAADPTGPSSA